MENKELNIIANDKIKEEYKKSLNGIIDGVKTGYASIDKPWLSIYRPNDVLKPLPKMTAYRYLYENNKDYPNNPAINYLGFKVSYKELFEKIDKINTAFQKIGVKKGDVVEILGTNTPEIAYIFYALSKLGAIAEIVDPRIHENVIKKYLDDSKAKVFMCLDLVLPNYQDMLDKSDVEYVISLPILESVPMPMKQFAKAKALVDSVISKQPLPPKIKKANKKVWSYKEFENLGKKVQPLEAEYEENTPVAILHTGGTTGIPKGAVLSNDNLNALVAQFKKTDLMFERGQKWLSLMPPCVAYGLANGIHLSLSYGMESIMIPDYVPDKIDEQILKYHPNRIACTTAHYEKIEKSPKLEGKDLSYIINPIEGGDSLNTNMERRINEKLHRNGCYSNVNKGYGLTESCAALCVASPKVDQEPLIGSIGYPLPDTVISIFNTDEETGKITELKYNEIGEICACAPQVMLRYNNKPEETANTLRKHDDGKVWIHTGDLGYITEDGRIFHKGRSKRIIIRYDGAKMYPFDIESVISNHPAVRAVAVVSIKDENYVHGSLPKAYIVLKPGYDEKTSLSEINELCVKNLVYYMMPQEFEVIDELPKTPLGKIDFKNLEDRNNKTNSMVRKLEKN